jgi:hypothetical protein
MVDRSVRKLKEDVGGVRLLERQSDGDGGRLGTAAMWEELDLAESQRAPPHSPPPPHATHPTAYRGQAPSDGRSRFSLWSRPLLAAERRLRWAFGRRVVWMALGAVRRVESARVG